MIKLHLRKLKRLASRGWRSLDVILSHPLTQKDRLGALWRYFSFHLLGRLITKPLVFPYIGGIKFFARPGRAGIVGNIYMGLEDFEEQAFLLHFLRPNDLFVDVGANVGSYSLLASGICGAKSLAFEPVPDTFEELNRNIQLNGLSAILVSCNVGVGAEKKRLAFTSSLDVLNRVVLPGENLPVNTDVIMVDMITLDEFLAGRSPILLKIDVEGYEQEVVRGSESVLRSSSLKAVMIELCGLESRYGFSYEYVHEQLVKNCFTPFSYHPFERRLEMLDTFNHSKSNTLYIRDLDDVIARIKSARSVKVLDQLL